MSLRNFLLSFLLLTSLALPSHAAELIMFERKGCHYCIEWKDDLGPIYPNTAEGKYAPLRMVDVGKGTPKDISLARKVIYTPTFVLVENNAEIGRIEGYPGEDFFWGMLNMMLKAKTDFVDASG
ncbi:thioredoxin family protein [Thalassovita sp.]|jgi:thioredoxin-related protein|uniref:thioredoxin family protein n=1 Tax=Thalassovita sp. TaxID=1979401 RepID=UPI003B5BBCDA